MLHNYNYHIVTYPLNFRKEIYLWMNEWMNGWINEWPNDEWKKYKLFKDIEIIIIFIPIFRNADGLSVDDDCLMKRLHISVNRYFGLPTYELFNYRDRGISRWLDTQRLRWYTMGERQWKEGMHSTYMRTISHNHSSHRIIMGTGEVKACLKILSNKL